jgi:hypothetical protein
MGKLVACLVLASTLCFGASASPEQVAKWTKKWQGKLGMGDWVVTGRIAGRELMDLISSESGALGHSNWNQDLKVGYLYVLSGRDYPRFNRDGNPVDVKSDQELTVVHELTHMLLGPGSEEKKVDSISKLIFYRNR